MAARVEQVGGRRWSGWRIAGWSLAALIMLLPAVAMRFTKEVNWDSFDFVFMGVLLGGVGLGIEFLVRKSGSLAYRIGAVVALITVFLTIWVNGAAGMIGSEGNPYNFLFLGVVLVGLVGAVFARFRPAGMARAMAVTAAAQAAAGAGGLFTDMRGGVFSIGFAAPWLMAAFLFWLAAREGSIAREERVESL